MQIYFSDLNEETQKKYLDFILKICVKGKKMEKRKPNPAQLFIEGVMCIVIILHSMTFVNATAARRLNLRFPVRQPSRTSSI